MLRIYGRANSSNVQKVLWCCGELDLAFERIDMGREFGGNDTPDYLALNPNGTVPTIDDDGFVLWESNAIVRYLAARHGAGTLYPADPRVRAAGERWMDWQLSVMHPAFGPLFHALVREPPERREAAAVETARRATVAALAILDRQLGESDYLAGSAFTVGDIPLGIYAYRWYAFDVDHGDLPHLRRWYERLAERPAYRRHVMVGLA